MPEVVAFIALEADDGMVGGLCVCTDGRTLKASTQSPGMPNPTANS